MSITLNAPLLQSLRSLFILGVTREMRLCDKLSLLLTRAQIR
jgi:hypothetical protein